MSSFLGATGPVVEQAWAWFVVVGTLVLLVAAWRVLGALVARHKAVDTRAGMKRLAAVVFALALGGGGWLMLSSFEAQSKEGMHKTFTNALNLTVGESDYLDAGKTITNKPAAIAIQQANIASYQAAIAANPANATAIKALNETQAALVQSFKDLATAHATQLKLTANHMVWTMTAPLLSAHQDDAARSIFDRAIDPATLASVVGHDAACARDDNTGLCLSPYQPGKLAHSYRDTHTLQTIDVVEGVPEAYDHQVEFNAQMTSEMRWFVYPNLTGFALAPFAFAGGSILRRSFVPSETVGFKPYPGKAAGFFLLMGGCAVFAIPFSAWLLRDFSKRSKEGQINL